jgi:hypothetical protein
MITGGGIRGYVLYGVGKWKGRVRKKTGAGRRRRSRRREEEEQKGELVTRSWVGV